MIHVSALGPVEVIVDGSEAPKELRWRKNLGLVVYVARSPRGRRSRDLLTSVFWGDKPETTGRHSLNEALRVIRKQLPEGALSAEGDHVTLEPGAVTFDLDAFQAHAEAGELDEARVLIRGLFMEGFSIPDSNEFEDWLSGERRIWRQHCTDVLEKVASAHLEDGDLTAARTVAHQAETLDPVADTAVAVLMQCDALRGDPSAALATYQDFADRLQRELGLDPPESVKSLADRIRAQREVADAAVRSESAVLSRRLPLTGRGPELRDAVEVVRACRSDSRATLLVITGGPGTGKTRLAEEVILRAELDGFRSARVRCDEADRRTRHGAFGALLTDTAVFGDRVWFDDVHAFGKAVSEAARERPLLIWVDSAEFLDSDSYLEIAPLLRAVAEDRVTILLSANGSPPIPELDALAGRLGRDFPGRQIELEGIEAQDLRSLACRSLPEWSDDEIDRLARRLGEDTGGLPLLVVDMLHALHLGLEIEDATPQPWPDVARTMDQTFPGDIPKPLGAAIRVGFRRLSPEAQEVLKLGSLAASRVTVELLERATDLDRATILEALDELEWRRWLTAEPRGYGFVARLHRDVIEQDMMTKGQRQRMLERLS